MMKEKKSNVKNAFVLVIFISCIFFDPGKAEPFKLSSLPQLKKWEIPSMPQKYALRTGRKFKNIDEVFETGRKRSSHWSIKPELNFRELDFEDDAEKIKLDHNYKAFIDDDDIPAEGKMKEALAVGELNRVSSKRFGLTEKRSKPSKLPRSSDFSNVSRKGTTLQKEGSSKYSSNKKAKSKESSRDKARIQPGKFKEPVKASAAGEHKLYEKASAKLPLVKVDLLDSSAGQGTNRFSTADIRSIKQAVKPYASSSSTVLSKVAKDADIYKRSAENDFDGNLMTQKYAQKAINEAVKRARISMNNLQSRKQNVAKIPNHFGQLKPAVPRAGKVQRSTDANVRNGVQQKNLQESRSQALKLLGNSVYAKKGQVKSGVLGDQPSKNVLNKIKNSSQIKATSANAVMNAKVPSPPVTASHGTQLTKGTQISQRTKIESPRGDIEKPKEKVKIVPANVARAVAMAMEQLKRDRMWGKVFVHVLPSGKLKVMVQETKKMPDE